MQAEIEARSLVEQQRRELEARLNDAERLKSLGMLAAGVAHDFNNLLVGVVRNADVLLHMQDLPDPWRSTLDVIRRTGVEASELTRQLLMFAGQGGMKKTAVDVTEAIAGSIELLRRSTSWKPRCAGCARHARCSRKPNAQACSTVVLASALSRVMERIASRN